MANHPEEYLQELKDSRATEVFAHIEAMENPKAFIDSCHTLGLKAGFAIKVNTSLSELEPFYQWLDKILFLTSVPRNRTEEFHFPAFERALKSVDVVPHHIELIADGGLSSSDVYSLAKAGFKGVVLGRLVFSNPDPLCLMQDLRSNISLQGGSSK